jgi:hypothetical protein
MGVVGLSACIGYDLIQWLKAAPEEFRKYSFQRVLFYVGTNTDVPLLPLAAAGAACWLVGSLRSQTTSAFSGPCGQNDRDARLDAPNLAMPIFPKGEG